MKTIKIFLASSDELKDEREKFGNLIRQLDDIFFKRGIHIQLLVWEDMDPCYNNCRKQDEYNAWIRESQIFVALFYTRAGQYTLEELEVARTENRRRKEPKLMIYCRNLQPGDVEEKDLLEFKETLEKKLGHFWGNYATTDKLHLDFVMYFMRSTEDGNNALKVENGMVLLDDFMVARMDNLPFAAGNEGYQRMQRELHELSTEIEETRSKLEKKQQKFEKKKNRLEQDPNDEEYKEEYEETKEEVEDLTSKLQLKLNKYNALQKLFISFQQTLLDTAKRVSEMQLENVNSELRRAMDEFDNGHIEAANAILDGIEREADRHMEQLDCDRELVHQDIEAFLLQTKTVMADTGMSIKERIKKTKAIFAKADEWAQKSALPEKKCERLIADYGHFLSDNALYHKALSVYQRLIFIRERRYGLEHLDTGRAYNNVGGVYMRLGDYNKALEYFYKALAIREKVLGLSHQSTAAAYNNIGLVYHELANYDKALEFYFKALPICEKVLGVEHKQTASTYNNIGLVYSYRDDFNLALEYYLKAQAIREKKLGIEHPSTAILYINIGYVYYRLDENDKALEYYFKAYAIIEKVIGLEHPLTATLYNNIGAVYKNDKDYDQALKSFYKALAIQKKVFNTEHPDTATSYGNIGDVYDNLGDYDKALEYNSKALAIFERVYGKEHPRAKITQESINELKQKKI